MNSTTRSTRTTHPTATRPSRWSSFRDRMRAQRAARAQQDEIWRQLDGYRSAHELEELLIAAGRSSEPEAEITRQILHAKLAHMTRGSFVS